MQVSECQALDGNPSLWLFGNSANNHVGSCQTVSESVSLSVNSVAKALPVHLECPSLIAI